MSGDPVLADLTGWLSGVTPRAVACSGGVDSMLLATVAHRRDPTATTIVHDVTPAVPSTATARVLDHTERNGWTLRLVSSEEFDDERYLANPRNRCYFCKDHLYDAMSHVVAAAPTTDDAVMLSGTNVDDLGEYRPGLIAAEEHGVRHPYAELGITKSDIRRIAGSLGLDFADLPASPCLASRLYTGTRVTANRLRAIEIGEDLLRRRTGRDVIRCRIDGTTVRVESASDSSGAISDDVLHSVLRAMQLVEPPLQAIEADPRGYRPGRAFELVVRS